MKKLFVIFLIQFQLVFSQKILNDFPLSKVVEETSGLEVIGDSLITFNDSGGEPAIYYMSYTGEIIKKRNIINSKNKDWEDITKDNKFLYIGDFGNNLNNRKDLKIYKVPLFENIKIDNETIYFSYPEQESFKININTIYDAEGLISFENKLVLFTKNRAKKITEVYTLSKNAGEQKANKINEINVGSIVTGADYNKDLELLALTSTINFIKYYIITINNFSLEKGKQFDFNITEIPIGKTQVESIKIIDKNTFWITSEDESSSKSARLLKIKINDDN
jgi:hypothetical protein